MIIRNIILILFVPATAFSQTGKSINDHLYFDQPAPGNTPVLFAPGIVSDEYGNRDMAISPGGDELFYTVQYRGGFAFSVIMYSKKVNGKWTSPEVASFSGQYNDEEPAFSPDGKKLYFSSNRPVMGTEKKDYDIWFITKEKGSWGEPQNIGGAVNTSKDEFYPSIAKSGNIYFTRQMEGKDEDIVMCRYNNNNKYDTAVSLPDAINTKGAEFNAFVDPDEQFIFFTGYKRKGNIGTGDLFISRRNSNGAWEEARNLGDKINGAGNTYCPYVSPDKKYFFFTSSRGIFKTPFEKKQDLKGLKSFMNSPWNGWDNIYWVEAKEIIGSW
jgi:Tol biopolymer transport system component